MSDGDRDIGLDALRRRLLDVRHVLEVVPRFCARSAAEVVECDRGVALLGEPEGDLLVEPVQPTDVWEDDDADARMLLRRRGEGGEPVAVRCPQDEVIVGDRGPGDPRIGGEESWSKHDATLQGRHETLEVASLVHQPTEARTSPVPGSRRTTTPASSSRATTAPGGSPSGLQETSVPRLSGTTTSAPASRRSSAAALRRRLGPLELQSGAASRAAMSPDIWAAGTHAGSKRRAPGQGSNAPSGS